MRCESGRHVKRRITATISTAIDVHRVRQVAAADLAVITHHVAAIKRIRRRETSRLKSIRADDCVGSTKNLREELVALLHLGTVIMNQRIRRQKLPSAKGVRIL